MADKKSVISRQRLLICKALKKDPSFNALHYVDTEEDNVKWNKLTKKLNSVPNGARKSVAGWKEVFDECNISVLRKAMKKNPVSVNDMDILENSVHIADRNLVKMLYDPQRRLFKRMQKRAIENTIKTNPDLPPALWHRLSVCATNEAISLMIKDRLRGSRIINNENIHGTFDCPQRRVTIMQLERMHHVSQDLDSNIKKVQDRIQMIKDRWQHDCEDEE